MFIDFHTHLDWYTDSKSLETQLSFFSGKIVSASVNLESYKKNLELSQKFPFIIPAPGIHPQNADEEINRLKDYEPFLTESKIIAEIGMDFFWCKTNPLNQEKVFRFFLEHASLHKKCCVIHTKGAEEKVLNILAEYPGLLPVIHWYDGPEQIFKQFLNRNYMVTFGNETARSKYLQKLLKMTPPDQLLLETDNPDSEPWLIEQYNETKPADISPALIERVYSETAKILELTPAKLNSIINNNFERIMNQ